MRGLHIFLISSEAVEGIQTFYLPQSADLTVQKARTPSDPEFIRDSFSGACCVPTQFNQTVIDPVFKKYSAFMWTSDPEGFKGRIECSCLCCICPLNHSLLSPHTLRQTNTCNQQPTFKTDKQGGEQLGLLPPHFPKPCLGPGWLCRGRCCIWVGTCPSAL